MCPWKGGYSKWKALKEQELGLRFRVRFEDLWEICEGCLDFILRAMEANEGPEAQGKGWALLVQVNKDIDTEKERLL